MSLVEKIARRFADKGTKEAVRSIAADVRLRVADKGREVIVLKVDLDDPKNRVRDRDRPDAVAISTFDRSTLPDLVDMLSRHAPELVGRVRQRFLEGMCGFVASDGGEIIGYTFYTPGADDPERIVHRDLLWLPVRPSRREVYAFDYYVREASRGRGSAFVRAVQAAQHRLGFTASYGYVYAQNRPALWLYRTTGWKEIARVREDRYLSKLAVVDGTVYWMQATSRSPILRLGARRGHSRPGGDA